jgi:hypothetical protein
MLDAEFCLKIGFNSSKHGSEYVTNIFFPTRWGNIIYGKYTSSFPKPTFS